jgi:hypothetical protein
MKKSVQYSTYRYILEENISEFCIIETQKVLNATNNEIQL